MCLVNIIDFIEYVCICDGFMSILYFLIVFFMNDDIEVQVFDVWRFYICLINICRLVVLGVFFEYGVLWMVDMMQLFCEDVVDLIVCLMLIFIIIVIGNFWYGEDLCQNIFDCVDCGILVEIVLVILQGFIVLVMLVGVIVFYIIDVFVGLIMVQIV